MTIQCYPRFPQLYGLDLFSESHVCDLKKGQGTNATCSLVGVVNTHAARCGGRSKVQNLSGSRPAPPATTIDPKILERKLSFAWAHRPTATEARYLVVGWAGRRLDPNDFVLCVTVRAAKECMFGHVRIIAHPIQIQVSKAEKRPRRSGARNRKEGNNPR
jgi:hypothetical protein